MSEAPRSPGKVVRTVRRQARRWWKGLGADRWRNRPYTSTAQPVIVGGCGRSGTTLMRVILDTHPSICCGPESNLFLPQWPSVRRQARRFSLTEAAIQDLLRATGSQAEFLDRFFAEYCARQKKARWAEKTPKNVQYLDFIFEHFPEARFIHMIRDGRDTVCSLRTHPRYKVVNGELIDLHTRHPLDQCITRWVEDVGAGFRHRHDPRYLEVRYEDLVGSPRPTLERVFAFLGEPFDERVLEYHQVKGESRNVVNFPQNPEATRAMYTGAVSRWQRDLTAEEIALFKRMAGPLLVEAGYAANGDW